MGRGFIRVLYFFIFQMNKGLLVVVIYIIVYVMQKIEHEMTFADLDDDMTYTSVYKYSM